MKPLKTAVIGFGRVAAGYAADTAMAQHYPYASHAQVLRDHKAFEWVAAVDPSADARASATSQWNVGDMAETVGTLKSRNDIEVAVLATPPGPSRLETLDALPALKAVIVEKPLGNSLAEGKAFLAACAKRNVVVQVNLWRRADETFRKLAEGGLARAIGTLQTGTIVYGNGLHNNGVHMIDMIRMLCGEIDSAQALSAPTSGPHLPLPGDIHVAAALTLRSGQVLFLTPLDFRAYRENGLDLWGTTGRLSVWQEGLYLAQYPLKPNRAMTGEQEVASDTPRTLEPSVGRAFYDLYDDLATALEKKCAPRSPGASALMSEAVVEAITLSARMRQPQKIAAP